MNILTIAAYVWFAGFIVSLPIQAMMSDYGEFDGIFIKALTWPLQIFKK